MKTKLILVIVALFLSAPLAYCDGMGSIDDPVMPPAKAQDPNDHGQSHHQRSAGANDQPKAPEQPKQGN